MDCGDLPDPDNGLVQLTNTTLGAAAAYDCDFGFQLNGVETRTCIETGEWSDEAPTCTRT